MAHVFSVIYLFIIFKYKSEVTIIIRGNSSQQVKDTSSFCYNFFFKKNYKKEFGYNTVENVFFIYKRI